MAVAVAKHGTAGGYTNRKCRCDACRGAFYEHRRNWLAEKRAQRRLIDGRMIHPTVKHGTINGYCNYGCRCQPCTEAWATRARQRRGTTRDRRVD